MFVGSAVLLVEYIGEKGIHITCTPVNTCSRTSNLVKQQSARMNCLFNHPIHSILDQLVQKIRQVSLGQDQLQWKRQDYQVAESS